jgi:hypothetical protein
MMDRAVKEKEIVVIATHTDRGKDREFGRHLNYGHY